MKLGTRQARQACRSTQTMGCTEPGALAGPRVHPASPAVLRGQHSGSRKVRAPKGRGGDRHRQETGTDRGAGETHAAQSARPHLCGTQARPPPAAAAPRGPPPRAWPGRAPVPPSWSVRASVPWSLCGHRPSPGGWGGCQWMTSAPPRPPCAPGESARARQALRSARCAGSGGGSLPPPGAPPPAPSQEQGSQSAGSWADPRVASPGREEAAGCQNSGAGHFGGGGGAVPLPCLPTPHLYGPGVPAQPGASIQEVSWSRSSALIGWSSHVSLHGNHLPTPWQPEPVGKTGPRGSPLPHPSLSPGSGRRGEKHAFLLPRSSAATPPRTPAPPPPPQPPRCA